MLSILDVPPATAISKTQQTIRVIYRVAPLSVCRQERGRACFIFQAAGESGVIIIPYPKWFKKHTWQKATKLPAEGKFVRYKTETRGFKHYLDEVVLDMVSKLLRKKKYSSFKLEIAPLVL